MAFGGVDTAPSDEPFAFQQIDATTWEFSRDLLATDGTPFLLTKTYRFDLEYLFELRIRIENSRNAVPALDFGGISYTLGIAPQLGPDYARLDRRNEYREYMRYYPEGKRKRQRLRNDLRHRGSPRPLDQHRRQVLHAGGDPRREATIGSPTTAARIPRSTGGPLCIWAVPRSRVRRRRTSSASTPGPRTAARSPATTIRTCRPRTSSIWRKP